MHSQPSSPDRRSDFSLPFSSPVARETLVRVVADLQSITDPALSADEVESVRESALSQAPSAGNEGQLLRVWVSVFCDLRGQGWSVHLDQDTVTLERPEGADHDPMAEKERVRAGLVFERDRQLRSESTRKFIRGMETRRFGPAGWCSIYDLMRDGAELEALLSHVGSISPPDVRLSALREAIQPYLQPVDDGLCEFTGLKLKDIWRYFRHTWASPYKSVPGRSIQFLVRDRAAASHPILGIGALGSSIVQLRDRDRWIGWTLEALAERVGSAEDVSRWDAWLRHWYRELVDAIYVEDLLRDGVIAYKEIDDPTSGTILALRADADEAKARHQLNPRPSRHKGRPSGGLSWAEKARTDLFRSKRAAALAKLLQARIRLLEAGFDFRDGGLRQALAAKSGREAVRQILRMVRARHIGLDMLDIVVCGALPPYSALLGGKLVSLLLASPKAIEAVRSRYGDTESVIASSMAGHAVIRPPHLVLLCTTSLYGVGSSQYNRLRVPADAVGGIAGARLEYQKIGRTRGYGSFHFSDETVREISLLSAHHNHSRRVNSIFGEGVSPRFRKIRDGLDLSNLPSDVLLQHGSPRIVYGVPLASNFRDMLIGMDEKPEYIVPMVDPDGAEEAIVAFWIDRWLSRRVENPRILASVAGETLLHPISHGARVRLPEDPMESPLFANIGRESH